MDLKGILFDKDGTLFDFDATWGAWCRTFLRDLTSDPVHQDVLAQSIGYSIESGTFLPDSPVIADTPETIASRLLPHLPNWDLPRLLDHMNTLAAQAPQVEIVPLAGVLDALGRRNLILGVATNDAESAARAHLSGAGVLDRFAFVSGFDSGHGGKPDPGPLLAFAHATGVPAGQIAMVGDSAHDMHAARAAGMVAIAVAGDGRNLATLTVLADKVLTDISELPAWLDSLQ